MYVCESFMPSSRQMGAGPAVKLADSLRATMKWLLLVACALDYSVCKNRDNELKEVTTRPPPPPIGPFAPDGDPLAFTAKPLEVIQQTFSPITPSIPQQFLQSKASSQQSATTRSFSFLDTKGNGANFKLTVQHPSQTSTPRPDHVGRITNDNAQTPKPSAKPGLPTEQPINERVHVNGISGEIALVGNRPVIISNQHQRLPRKELEREDVPAVHPLNDLRPSSRVSKQQQGIFFIPPVSRNAATKLSSSEIDFINAIRPTNSVSERKITEPVGRSDGNVHARSAVRNAIPSNRPETPQPGRNGRTTALFQDVNTGEVRQQQNSMFIPGVTGADATRAGKTPDPDETMSRIEGDFHAGKITTLSQGVRDPSFLRQNPSSPTHIPNENFDTLFKKQKEELERKFSAKEFDPSSLSVTEFPSLQTTAPTQSQVSVQRTPARRQSQIIMKNQNFQEGLTDTGKTRTIDFTIERTHHTGGVTTQTFKQIVPIRSEVEEPVLQQAAQPPTNGVRLPARPEDSHRNEVPEPVQMRLLSPQPPIDREIILPSPKAPAPVVQVFDRNALEEERRYREEQRIFREDQRRYREQQRKFAEDRRRFEESRRRFEEDQRRFEEQRRKYEQDKKRFETEQQNLQQQRVLDERIGQQFTRVQQQQEQQRQLPGQSSLDSAKSQQPDIKKQPNSEIPNEQVFHIDHTQITQQLSKSTEPFTERDVGFQSPLSQRRQDQPEQRVRQIERHPEQQQQLSPLAKTHVPSETLHFTIDHTTSTHSQTTTPAKKDVQMVDVQVDIPLTPRDQAREQEGPQFDQVVTEVRDPFFPVALPSLTQAPSTMPLSPSTPQSQSQSPIGRRDPSKKGFNFSPGTIYSEDDQTQVIEQRSPARTRNATVSKIPQNEQVFVLGNFGNTARKTQQQGEQASISKANRNVNDGSGDLPGTPGVDYPNYAQVPETSFDCKVQESAGMYADIETRCQAFHNCDPLGHKMSFLCPNGTVFKQELFICDWWYNVQCTDSNRFFHLNTNKYTTARPRRRRRRGEKKRKASAAAAAAAAA
ncbi:heat shock protein DDB_G0288861-like isoform X1 [Varroa destructor]|uniref:Chitin-binding type-2 domain-containing protein n=2 Tax=Varroa destructor TaxID=109461 RepID=A0A7M7JL37_VARDE|nr:heat shock protein DDB_G0288861-like isoform X1 [Varroa destructor]XP_022653608.1 heat shock protein DDB_G0288861-like isoform X1 [Varroa destructor]